MKRPVLASKAVAEGFGWTNTPEYQRGVQQLQEWHRECARRRYMESEEYKAKAKEKAEAKARKHREYMKRKAERRRAAKEGAQ